MTSPSEKVPATEDLAATEFAALQETWQTLGKDDPLWAILTDPDRRGRGWDLEEFLATGEADVAKYEVLLHDAGHSGSFASVLDFGCGVGRLSLAWGRRATAVTGVDIAAAMIERGRQIVATEPNVRLLVNDDVDLRQFRDGTFDLAFSHICLQHMPWLLAAGYIEEFARITTPGGFVAFQLPSRGRPGRPTRRRIVDALPAGVRTRYRRWRHGTAAVFDMYYTRPEDVVAVAAGAGLELLIQQPDESAGVGIEGYIYVFRRRA